MPFGSGESQKREEEGEGLVRNVARRGLDEYTYRVRDERGLAIAHRFEFHEGYIDDEGIDEILATVERVMRRVRRPTADAAPTSAVALHLV